MDKYELNENEEIEFAEKERDFELSQEEEQQKRMADADDELNDLNEEHARNVGEIL